MYGFGFWGREQRLSRASAYGSGSPMFTHQPLPRYPLCIHLREHGVRKSLPAPLRSGSGSAAAVIFHSGRLIVSPGREHTSPTVGRQGRGDALRGELTRLVYRHSCNHWQLRCGDGSPLPRRCRIIRGGPLLDRFAILLGHGNLTFFEVQPVGFNGLERHCNRLGVALVMHRAARGRSRLGRTSRRGRVPNAYALEPTKLRIYIYIYRSVVNFAQACHEFLRDLPNMRELQAARA